MKEFNTALVLSLLAVKYLGQAVNWYWRDEPVHQIHLLLPSDHQFTQTARVRVVILVLDKLFVRQGYTPNEHVGIHDVWRHHWQEFLHLFKNKNNKFMHATGDGRNIDRYEYKLEKFTIKFSNVGETIKQILLEFFLLINFNIKLYVSEIYHSN